MQEGQQGRRSNANIFRAVRERTDRESGHLTKHRGAIGREHSYDVPIPKPTSELGFHGIREKRSHTDASPRGRRDN